MPLTRVSVSSLEADILRHERQAERTLETAVKGFLGRVKRAAVDALPSGAITAAGSAPLTLGQMYGWWTSEVEDTINPVIADIWRSGYTKRTDAVMTGTSLDEFATYMAAVNDRLVRGLTPSLPDDAFNAVRQVITQGAALGWSTKQTAQGIGASLAWEKQGDYYRKQQAAAAKGIDAILDPLGPPGTPSREAARMSDPRVNALQAAHAAATKALAADASHWESRATLIARTESIGAYNYGALHALIDEGVGCKRWLAISDARTRLTHRTADGQVVRVRETFDVGGASLRMPGDPSGPPAEVCNCRCTLVQADCDDYGLDNGNTPTVEPEFDQEFYDGPGMTGDQHRTWFAEQVGVTQRTRAMREYLAARPEAWQDAHDAYTGAGYDAINSFLRGTQARGIGFKKYTEAEVRDMIRELSVMEHTLPLKEDMLLFRGIRATKDVNPGDWQAGDAIVDPGFLSTTTEFSSAKAFGTAFIEKGVKDKANSWVLRIRAQAGNRFIEGSEDELIFQPGTTMHVRKVDRENNIVYVDIRR